MEPIAQSAWDSCLPLLKIEITRRPHGARLASRIYLPREASSSESQGTIAEAIKGLAYILSSIVLDETLDKGLKSASISMFKDLEQTAEKRLIEEQSQTDLPNVQKTLESIRELMQERFSSVTKRKEAPKSESESESEPKPKKKRLRAATDHEERGPEEVLEEDSPKTSSSTNKKRPPKEPPDGGLPEKKLRTAPQKPPETTEQSPVEKEETGSPSTLQIEADIQPPSALDSTNIVHLRHICTVLQKKTRETSPIPTSPEQLIRAIRLSLKTIQKSSPEFSASWKELGKRFGSLQLERKDASLTILRLREIVDRFPEGPPLVEKKQKMRPTIDILQPFTSQEIEKLSKVLDHASATSSTGSQGSDEAVMLYVSEMFDKALTEIWEERERASGEVLPGSQRKAVVSATVGQAIAIIGQRRQVVPMDVFAIMQQNLRASLGEPALSYVDQLEQVDIGPVSSRFLYHLVGDPIGTEYHKLVGYPSDEARSDLLRCLEKITAFGDQEFTETLTRQITALSQGSEFLEKLQSSPDPSQMIPELRRTLSSLPEGRSVVLPTKWAGYKQGHAIVLELKKTSQQDSYQLIVYNTGEGCQHHHCRVADGRFEVAPLILNNVSLETLSSSSFLYTLRSLSLSGHWNAQFFYNSFLASLQGTVEENPQFYGDIQRSGTCGFASQFYYLQMSTGKSVIDRIRVGVGYIALAKFVNDLELIGLGEDINLANQCLHYFAQLVIQANVNGSISSVELHELQTKLDLLQETVHTLQIEQSKKAVSLSERRPVISVLAELPVIGALMQSTIPQLPQGNVVIQEYDDFPHHGYVPPSSSSAFLSPPQTIPSFNFSTPSEIAYTIEKIIPWAESGCKAGYDRDILFKIDSFSRELAEACHAQQQLFQTDREAAERLAKACDTLGKIYTQAFLDRCTRMKVPITISPLVFSTLAHLISSIRTVYRSLEEIQGYPLCIGEALPNVVRTEDFQSESMLYDCLLRIGVPCDQTRPQDHPRSIIPLNGEDKKFSPFLLSLFRKYRDKANEQFRADPSFSRYSDEQKAALLLSKDGQDKARAIFPPAIFCLQSLDNLVYFLSLFNRAESIPHPMEVSWQVVPLEGKPILRKTPPFLNTSITRTEVYPHSWFRPRPEPCRREIADSYAAPSLSDLGERPQIALHALAENTYDIDTALATFGAHPEYFQSEDYRTLFEYILCEPEKIFKAFHSSILHSSVLNIVPFLERQLNIALVNQDTATILFLMRQHRLFFERIIRLLPTARIMEVRSKIAFSFGRVEEYLGHLPPESQHQHLFSYHAEKARFLNAAATMSDLTDGELDFMIASALIAQRTVTSQAPLLEYDTGQLLHTILKKPDVIKRLRTFSNTALNASLPTKWKSPSWKWSHDLCFVSEQPPLEYNLSTGTIFYRGLPGSLVETPIEFFQNHSVKGAIHTPLPQHMKQEGPGVFSFEAGSTSFKIEQHQDRLAIYKRVGERWYQYTETSGTGLWYKSKCPFEANVIQGQSAWIFDSGLGETILRIENDQGVPLFEAVPVTVPASSWSLFRAQPSIKWKVFVCDREGKRTGTMLLDPSSLPDNFYCFEQQPFVHVLSSGTQIEKIIFQNLGKTGLSFSFDSSKGVFRRDGRPEEVLLPESYIPELPGWRHKLVTQNENTGQKVVLMPAHRIFRRVKTGMESARAFAEFNVTPYINPLDTDRALSIAREGEDLAVPLFSYPVKDKRLIPGSAEEAAYLAYTYLMDQNYKESIRALSQISALPLSSSAINFLTWLQQDTCYDHDPRACVVRLKTTALLKRQQLLFHIKTNWEGEGITSFENYARSKHLCGTVVLTDEEIQVLYQQDPQVAAGPRPLVTELTFSIPKLPISQRRSEASLLNPDITKGSFENCFSILIGGQPSIKSRWQEIRQFSIDVFQVGIGDYSEHELANFERMLFIAAHTPPSDEQASCALLLAVFQQPGQFKDLSSSNLSEVTERAQRLLALPPKPLQRPAEKIKILPSKGLESAASPRPFPHFDLKDPGRTTLLPGAITATSQDTSAASADYARKVVFHLNPGSKKSSPIAQRECTEFVAQVQQFQEQAMSTRSFTIDPSFSSRMKDLHRMAEDTKGGTKKYRHNIKLLLRKEFPETSARAVLKTAAMAGFSQRIGIEDAVHALLLPFPDGFLRLNPALTEQDADELYKATINYLVQKTYQEHLQTTIKKAEKIAQSDLPSQEDLQELSLLLNTIRGYNPVAEPALLVFEAAFGSFLWPNKVDILRRFLSGDVEAQGKVIELIMASGKTAVLLPLMAFFVAQKNKVSVIVLPEQLFPSMAPLVAESLQRSLSTPIFSWQIQEDQPLSTQSLSAIHRGIEKAFKDHGVIILRPKDFTGLFLQCLFSMMPEGQKVIEGSESKGSDRRAQIQAEMFSLISDQKFVGEMIKPSHSTIRERQEIFQSIFGLMVTHGAFLFDEVDSIWDVLKEHLLSVSPQVPIDPISREVLCLLYSRLALLPSGVLTKEAFRSETSPSLIAAVIEHLEHHPDPRIGKIVVDKKQIIEEFLKGIGTKDSLFGLPPIIQDILSAARAQIQDILPETYTRVYSVHYGEAPRTPGQSLTPYAIPYENGIPTHARCGHDFEEMNYTMQMFLHMSPDQFLPYVVNILKELQIQVRQELVEAPSLSIKETEAGRWLISCIGDPKIVELALFRPESGGREIVDRLQKNSALQIFFIERFIISKIQRPVSYLHTTTQLYALLASVVRGFSGTIWNKATYPVPAELSPESIGKTMTILSQERDQTVLVEAKASAIAVKDHGIIDIGGLLAEENPRSVAKKILDRCDPRAIQGVVFYDEDKKPKVLHRSIDPQKEGNVCLYEEETLPPEQLTAYWSEPFTTGSDLKISSRAYCLVTISKDTQLSSLLQGVWRLRKLGKGQHVKFVIDEDTKKIICTALGLPYDTELLSHHIIAYTLAKQIERQASDNYRSLRHRASAILERGFIQAFLVFDPSALGELYEACSELFVHTPPSRLYDRYATKAQELSADDAIRSIIEKTLNSKAFLYLCKKGILRRQDVEAQLHELHMKKAELPERVSEVIPEIGTKVQVQTQTQTQAQKQVQTQTQQNLSEVSFVPKYRYSIVKDFRDKIRPESFTSATLFQNLEPVQQNSIFGACIRLRDLFAAEPSTQEMQDFFPAHLGTTVNLHQAFQPGFTLMTRKGAFPAEYALSIKKEGGERAMVLLSQEDAENIHRAAALKEIRQTRELSVCLVNIHSGSTYPVIGDEQASLATQHDFDVFVDRLRLKIFNGDGCFTAEEKIGLLFIASTLDPDGSKKILSFVKNFSLAIHPEETAHFAPLETLFADCGQSCVQNTIAKLSPQARSTLFTGQPLQPPYSREFFVQLRESYLSDLRGK
jgi:hypothetical protein